MAVISPPCHSPTTSMNRQSTANRTVYGASGQPSQNSNALSLARLTEKKKEINAVTALETASLLCVKRLEAMGQDFNLMADSGEGSFTKRCK